MICHRPGLPYRFARRSFTPCASSSCSINVQVAAGKKRKAEEMMAWARAEEERQAAENAEDKSAAQQRAKELRANVVFHREGPLPADSSCLCFWPGVPKC